MSNSLVEEWNKDNISANIARKYLKIFSIRVEL